MQYYKYCIMLDIARAIFAFDIAKYIVTSGRAARPIGKPPLS